MDMCMMCNELRILIKKKTTIIAILILIIGTIFTGMMAVDHGGNYIKDNTIIKGKEAVLLLQEKTKGQEGRVDHETLQAYIKYLYAFQKQADITTTDKINYIASLDAMAYEPYSKLFLKIYEDSNTDYHSVYDTIFSLDYRSEDVYQAWRNKVISSRHAKTKMSKQDVKEKVDNVNIPFYFEPGSFVQVGVSQFQDVMLLIYSTVVVVFASLFSRDRATKTDQVILTTRKGKQQVRRAKWNAGILFSTAICLGSILLYNLVIASQIGINGLFSSIQMGVYALSPYVLTNIQAYILLIVFAIIMNITITSFVLFVSDRSKKAYVVILIAFLLLFIAYMINSSGTGTSKLMTFLPFGIIEKNIIFSYCHVVFHNISVYVPWIVTIVYLAFSMILRTAIVQRRN